MRQADAGVAGSTLDYRAAAPEHSATLGIEGTRFAVWAPNAAAVHVIGDFNGWNHDTHPMTVRPDDSGIWELFIPQVGKGTVYKYFVRSRYAGYAVEKSDPYAFMCEEPPRTGAVVWDNGYDWQDIEWQRNCARVNALDAPWSIYEVHLGSWKRVPDDGNRSLNYREVAHELEVDLRQRPRRVAEVDLRGGAGHGYSRRRQIAENEVVGDRTRVCGPLSGEQRE